MRDAVFIDVEIDKAVAGDPGMAAKLAEVCPVDIYAQEEDGTLRIVEENLDECVLCRLCIDASPAGTVRVRKLYSGEALEQALPELPEAESARRQIERVLGRRIVAVDDRDAYVCRPHARGEIEGVLVGRRFTAAHRRGKFLWAETGPAGPELGLHLGMTGSIVVDAPPVAWDRFAVEFEGGGRMALRDRRRLGRAVVEPDFSHVGPDAAEVPPATFRMRVGRGRAPIKARLLDQRAVAGVGNLLADEALWRARLSPRRPSGELSAVELDRLHRHLRAAVADAVRLGGAHTGEVIPARRAGAGCPRCGAGMVRDRIGGRTTWSCPRCQPWG